MGFVRKIVVETLEARIRLFEGFVGNFEYKNFTTVISISKILTSSIRRSSNFPLLVMNICQKRLYIKFSMSF